MLTGNEIIVSWRKGTIDDPYIDKLETLKVVGNRVWLEEVPDKFEHVNIPNYTEVQSMAAITSVTKYYVDYTKGIVHFHPDADGTTVEDIQYKGRGVVLIGARRVYVQSETDPDVIDNLQNIIDTSSLAAGDANDAADSANSAAAAASAATASANTATSNANAATTNANNAADNLVNKGDYSAVATYSNRNIVMYNGSLFQCISPTNIIGTAPTDLTKWKLIGTGLNPRGTWDSGTAYNPMDMVLYVGSTYLCKVATTAGILPTDATKWYLVAQSATMQNAQLSNDPTVDMEAATKKYVDLTASNKDADILRATTHSGVLDYVNLISGWTNSVNATVGGAQAITTLAGTAGANIFVLNKTKVLVNGRIFNVLDSNTSTLSTGTGSVNIVQTNTPPSSGLREDLVFLETWFDPADGQGMKNMRWRIRVVDGVDFASYPEGLSKNNAVVTAQGGNASPLVDNPGDVSTTRFYSAADRTTATSGSGLDILKDDVGLYVCGKGQSSDKTRFNSVDGYVYAIPLFKVRRRNTTAYNANTNPYGGESFWQVKAVAGPAVPVGQSQVTFTESLTGKLQAGKTYYRSDSLAILFKVVSVDSDTQATVINMSGAERSLTTYGLAPFSDRPDQRYSNIIYAEDIIDLRHQVSLTGFPYQNLLMGGFDKLLKATLHTNLKPRHRRDFIGLPRLTDDANTVLMCRFDNSMNGTANGATVTATQISAAAAYKNGTSGQSASFDGTTAREHRYALTGLTTAQGSIEWAATHDAMSTAGAMWALTNLANATDKMMMAYLGTNGTLTIFIYNDAGTLVASFDWAAAAQEWAAGLWRTLRVDWDANGTYLYAENVLKGTFASFASVTSRVPAYLTVGAGSNGTSLAYKWNGRIDELRVSNIRRPTNVFQVPTDFNWANGDRIIDGPDGVRSYWSDDAAVACGLGDVSQSFSNSGYAECQYPVGTPVRHYYQRGATPGFALTTMALTTPTNALDSSAENITVTANEAADGSRVTFTFTKPASIVGNLLLNSSLFSNPVRVAGSSVTPSSITVDALGLVTATLAAPPTGGQAVTFIYVAGSKHLHLVPNTKGFVMHDWIKYTFTTLAALTDPTAAITLTTAGGGSLAAATYHVNYCAVDANGAMTLLSTTPASQAVGANGKLTITAPIAGNLPVGTAKIRAYINSGSAVIGGSSYATVELDPGASTDVLTLTGVPTSTASSSNGTGVGTCRINNSRRVINVINHVRVTPPAGATTIQIAGTHVSYGADAYGDANHRVTFFGGFVPTVGSTVEVFVEEVVVPTITEGGFWVKYSHVPYQGIAVGGEKFDILMDQARLFITTNGTGLNESAPYNSVSGLSTMLPLGSGYSDGSFKGDSCDISGLSFSGGSWQNKFKSVPAMTTFAGLPPVPSGTVVTTSRGRRGLSASGGVGYDAPQLSSAVPHITLLPVLMRVSGEIMLGFWSNAQATTGVRSLATGGVETAFDLFRIEGRPLIK